MCTVVSPAKLNSENVRLLILIFRICDFDAICDFGPFTGFLKVQICSIEFLIIGLLTSGSPVTSSVPLLNLTSFIVDLSSFVPAGYCSQSFDNLSTVGFPFLLLGTGGGHLMRADGSPKMTMISNITGAVINIVLDALFVLVFKWGMEGAALATIIGQFASACIVLNYMRHLKTVSLLKKHLIPSFKYIKRIAAIGMGSFSISLL